MAWLRAQPANEDNSWLARLPEHMLGCHRAQAGDGSGCHWWQSMGIGVQLDVFAPSMKCFQQLISQSTVQTYALMHPAACLQRFSSLPGSV